MLVLIHGINSYQSHQELKKTLNNKNFSTIHADRVNESSELIFPTDNLSIFSSVQEISVIKNLSKNRKKSILNELGDYIENHIENINMVFFESEKFDARTKLFKLINKYGEVIETKTPDVRTLSKWLKKIMNKDGLEPSDRIIEQIISKVGTDQQTLSNEIEKLILLKLAENDKTIKTIDLEILTENNESVIFELLDALTHRDKRKALKIFEKLYTNDNDYPYISSMFAKQLKILYWLRSGEVSEMDVKSIFKVHPFIINKIKRDVYKFEPSFIKILYSKITNLDFKVKQGRIDPKLGLIMLISSV